MYVIKLLRDRESPQEYGRVIFDGFKVTFSGLTDVFARYFQLGIKAPDGSRCYPADGLKFMSALATARELFGGELFPSDLKTEDNA